MNKRERSLWRRKLRKERREARIAYREWASRHGGSYDNSILITPLTLPYSPVTSQYLYDNKVVNKTPKQGDFIHTTDYTKQVTTTRGKSFAGYRWRYDKGTTHTTGRSSVSAGGTKYGPAWYGGYSSTTSMRANMQSIAQSALNAKVLDDFPSWDILTDAAELKETIGFFGSLATSIKEVAVGVLTRSPKRVLRGFGVSATQRRVRHVKRVIQDAYEVGNTGHQTFTAISSLWMSYRYGLMPVIYSMQDALKAFCAPENDREYWATAQVTIPDTYFNDSITTVTSGVAHSSYKTHIAMTCSGSIRMKSYHRYTEGVKARLIANPWKNALITGYELIPFSFVLDWFYDIGGWLRSLQLDDIVAESWVNCSEKGNTLVRQYFSDLTPRPYYTSNFEYSPGVVHTGTNFYFRRWRGSLVAAAPRLEFGLGNFKRQLDSLSLSWQKVRLLCNRPPYVR